MDYLSEEDQCKVLEAYNRALAIFVKNHVFTTEENLEEELCLCLQTILYHELVNMLAVYENELDFNPAEYVIEYMWDSVLEDALAEFQ